MYVKMLAAVSSNLCLGKDNELVIKSSADMDFFKKQTKGHVLIVGRKTMESIGRVLPDRPMIVVTRDPIKFLTESKYGDSVFAVASKEEALRLAKKINLDAAIIGGAEIYEMFADVVNIFWLTRWNIEAEGDAFLSEKTLSYFSSENKIGILGGTYKDKSIKGELVGLAPLK